MASSNLLGARAGATGVAEGRALKHRGPLRLVKNDEDGSGRPPEPEEEGDNKRLSIGSSLAVWAVMAVLAWAVVALLLHVL
jgi:hypothetical protein